MSKYVVVATFETPTEHRAAFAAQLREHGMFCVANEPGTIAFDVLIPIDDEEKILLFEVYEDRAAFEAHWSSDRTTEGVKVAQEQGFFTGLSSVHCTLED